eukprot:COSAG02_NODE_36361_length_455_cov_1.446629_1_plen_151_part_11
MPVTRFGDPHPIASIEEGLHNYYETERLCGDRQWECPKCNKRVSAEKGLSLSKAPYILSVSLQRFVYDWERDRGIKLDDRVEFPMELDVAIFLAETPAPASEEPKAHNNDFGASDECAPRRFEMPYDLYAILIHDGTEHHDGTGHYYAFVK